VAPIDGRTGIRMVDEGNLVRASDVGIVMITEVKPISVLFTLPQQQLVAVNKALASGSVTVDAFDTDNKIALDRGSLQVVDNQVDPTTGTVRMKADFPNVDMQLWPGQFVNVRVLIETLNQVVVIPTPAVQRGPNGTFSYVVQADDVVASRTITVKQQTDTEAVIASGIKPSERVVTTGFARLKDGSRVVVTPGDKASPETAAATAATAGVADTATPPAEAKRKRSEGRRHRDEAPQGGERSELTRRAKKSEESSKQ
jgi:membrane fusion protein, multidrug efflux system